MDVCSILLLPIDKSSRKNLNRNIKVKEHLKSNMPNASQIYNLSIEYSTLTLKNVYSFQERIDKYMNIEIMLGILSDHKWVKLDTYTKDLRNVKKVIKFCRALENKKEKQLKGQIEEIINNKAEINEIEMRKQYKESIK